MNRILFAILAMGITSFATQAQQSTAMRVYEIVQAKCNNAGCHNTIDKAGGLDLQGDSPTAVYNNVYNKDPDNYTAKSNHNKLVYPGDPYRSYLFRKVAAGTESTIQLQANEGSAMPMGYPSAALTAVEREIIRQWILFGAPAEGTVVDETLLENFYSGGGYWANDPQNPPPAPDPSEGFQVRLGPIFLPPSTTTQVSETEYFSKYQLDIPATEVNRIDYNIGSSHHYIIYKFDQPSDADDVPYGFRKGSGGLGGFVLTSQSSGSTKLPEGTAFRWYDNMWLDLNTHVVNYSQSLSMATDVYMNVYTQPTGTSAQEMYSQLLPNPLLYIPSNGQEHTIETPFSYNINQQLYLWAVSSHTHKRGKGFEVWLRNSDGSKGDKIFDAKKYNGVPECEDIEYDYQHPPVRIFSPFLPMTIKNGIIHKATYLNDSGSTITWGDTTEDEMMITSVLFTLGTSGVTMPEASTCLSDEEQVGFEDQNLITTALQAQVLPNPFNDYALLHISGAALGTLRLDIFNILGEQVSTQAVQVAADGKVSVTMPPALQTGIYTYRLQDKEGKTSGGKFMVQ